MARIPDKLLKEYNENVLKYASNIREHIYKIKELEECKLIWSQHKTSDIYLGTKPVYLVNEDGSIEDWAKPILCAINAEIDSRIAAHKLSVETNKKALADIKDPSN